MRTGISRPTKGLVEAREMLALARRHGFEGVQFKPNQYTGLEGGLTRAAFDQAYGPLGLLARGGLIIYCPGNLELWKPRILPILDFAKAVGADQICVCASVRRPESGPAPHSGAAEILMEIGKLAQSGGLRLSLHNHAGSIFESREDILRMAELLDPAYCGLTMDTAHFAKAGELDLETLIPQISSHLLNVHLKDLDAEGRFCPLGRGRLNLSGVLRALRDCDYQEWLIVDEESIHVPVDEAFAISRKYLEGATGHE